MDSYRLGMARLEVSDGGTASNMDLRICLISSHGQPKRSCPPAWRLGEMLTTPYRKNVPCYEMFTHKASDPDSGNCECVNEPSGSIKCGDFLD
jgi:hypothetical protein